MASDLYTAYTSWSAASGERPVAKRTFGLMLAERGLRPSKIKANRFWKGIELAQLDD
jgi:hypothetical protein